MLKKLNQFFTEDLALKTLALFTTVYVVVFFTFCSLKYYGFDYADFDLAIHDQIIWNILHGSIYNSILGTDFLGNHVHLISFLVAPIYWFIPHPLFLLFLQTLFLAAGVVPLYALARLYHDHRMSLIIALIYLIYPGLGFTNLFEFHPTCFATFFLLCTAYYFYKENFLLFNVFMVLSLLCQENIALIFIMWGVYALFLKRQWKWVWWPSCLGLVYFLLCVYVILPFYNKNTFNFFNIYGPLGGSLGQIIHNCFLHPAKVLSLLIKPKKLIYLKELFIGVSFIPLLSPLALLPVILIFLQHLLSFRIGEISIHYHYTAEMIPFIFVAFIFGIKRITDFLPKFTFLGPILLVIACIVFYAIGPYAGFGKEWKRIFSDYSVAQKENLVEQVPKDAPVIATFEYLSHLSHRQYLYSFHYVYSGFNTLFTKKYHLPDNVQYALIDFNDRVILRSFYNLTDYQHIVDFIKQGPWGVVDANDSIVLFEKGVKDKYPLYTIIDDRTVVPYPVQLTVDKSFQLYGYDVSYLADRIHLTLYWKVLRHEKKDVNIFIDSIDRNGNMVDRQIRAICFRIWPTQAWPKGQLIEEHQYISITPEINVPLKSFKVGFVDQKTHNLIPTDSKDVLGRVELKIIH